MSYDNPKIDIAGDTICDIFYCFFISVGSDA